MKLFEVRKFVFDVFLMVHNLVDLLGHHILEALSCPADISYSPQEVTTTNTHHLATKKSIVGNGYASESDDLTPDGSLLL